MRDSADDVPNHASRLAHLRRGQAMRAVKILERVLITIPIMFGVAIIVFFFMRLTPGDPVDIMMGQGGAVSAGEMEQLRERVSPGRAAARAAVAVPQRRSPGRPGLFLHPEAAGQRAHRRAPAGHHRTGRWAPSFSPCSLPFPSALSLPCGSTPCWTSSAWPVLSWASRCLLSGWVSS